MARTYFPTSWPRQQSVPCDSAFALGLSLYWHTPRDRLPHRRRKNSGPLCCSLCVAKLAAALLTIQSVLVQWQSTTLPISDISSRRLETNPNRFLLALNVQYRWLLAMVIPGLKYLSPPIATYYEHVQIVLGKHVTHALALQARRNYILMSQNDGAIFLENLRLDSKSISPSHLSADTDRSWGLHTSFSCGFCDIDCQ